MLQHHHDARLEHEYLPIKFRRICRCFVAYIHLQSRDLSVRFPAVQGMSIVLSFSSIKRGRAAMDQFARMMS